MGLFSSRYNFDRWFSYNYTTTSRISSIAENKEFEIELNPTIGGYLKRMRVVNEIYDAEKPQVLFYPDYLLNLLKILIPDLPDPNSYTLYISSYESF